MSSVQCVVSVAHDIGIDSCWCLPCTVTHEPKLVRAKRIPEWTVYDDEIAAVAQRVALQASSGLEVDVSAIGAFAKRAEELRQAVEQNLERDEFVAEHAGDALVAEEDGGASEKVVDDSDHVRDEL